MGQDVLANGRSILHKGHGTTHTCAVPDVCKTPTPGGPVPIPYVNIAMDSDITDGAETVKIEGNPVANLGAKISTSTGDEAGSAGGGIISNRVKGTVTWKMGSLNVKAEGKSVVRFLDQDFHNGNSFNTAFVVPGRRTGVRYGDDRPDPCPVCGSGPDDHVIVETANTARICSRIIAALRQRFTLRAEQRQQYLVAKRDRYRKGAWAGYMVGVMICKDKPGYTPRVFAAMSGFQGVADFEEIALQAGPVDQVVPVNGPITSDDLIEANRSNNQNITPQGLSDAINNAWTNAQNNRSSGGRPPLGSCAAQRLIGSSGHAPTQMTEMWFDPPGREEPWRAQYNWRVNNVPRQGTAAPWFGPAVQQTADAPWGQTVASCHNCQDLLPLTLCPRRQCG